jgi:hypothetical protein
MMGGAFIPARLMPRLEELMETRLERIVRRLVEAEMDGVAVFGLLYEAVHYAHSRNLGLYEAEDVIVPGEPGSVPAGGQVVFADRKRLDPGLRQRLISASTPPKKPGLLKRLFGGTAQSRNGA